MDEEKEVDEELSQREKTPKSIDRVRAIIERDRALMQKSEIGVILETYNDVFSSFDPREYNAKSLSYDFLMEMKRAALDKPSGIIELRLLMPAKMRSFAQEAIIRRRLREHFKRHYMLLLEADRKIKRRAYWMLAIGASAMVAATLITVGDVNLLLKTALNAVLDPAGWFVFWKGLDELYNNRKEEKPELLFYEKMAQAEISFVSR